MIHVEHLSKAYGAIQALDDVSFHIEPGEIVGLLGPNGAGKTTIIKILTGYLQPDAGVVTIDGLDVLEQTESVQARLGYLPENAPLYPELTVQGYLKLIADLRLVPPAEQRDRILDAVHATGLTDRLTQPIGELSKGYRQRVGLAQAILHRPKLLILDEPTVGLDPTQVVEIRRLIRRLSEHSTILFSTHILSEVEALCDRVLMLMNGRVRADARISELAATGDAVLVLSQDASGVDAALRELEGVRRVEREQHPDGFPTYRIHGDGAGGDLCPAIYQLAAAQGWPVRELRNDVRTLESVFNELAVTA
ncbi:MAG: ATP-binding cassette domain-containing protein [Caldilineae bacterium]|nr:MAG: ATP-binding cassette domain-containing protein [Caldilineae bacterium]